MASPDTAPFVYDFKLSYYENYYLNRLKQMGTSGNFYHMWEEAWNLYDETKSVGGVAVNNGVDVTYYVHKHYNGDTPMCLTEKLVREIERIMDESWVKSSIVLYVALFVVAAIVKFVNKILGSFIVTATVNALDHECAKRFIEELKEYRDQTMTTGEARNMLRYYSVIGPRVVDAIEEDPQKDFVYKYIYSEYLTKLPALTKADKKMEVFHVYFTMMNEMIDRYQIQTSKRFKRWLSQQM